MVKLKVKKPDYSTVILWMAVILSLIIRYISRNYISGDFRDCLYPWILEFREKGGWYAIKEAIGNYNVVYQYLLITISYFENLNALHAIKIVSIIFDYILAFGCVYCLKALNVKKQAQNILFAIIILLPTICLNGAYWGQCDSIYVAFAVWSIYFLIKKKNVLSMIFLALAFAFKLQTIFIMPVYFVAFLKRELRIKDLIAFPVTYFVTCIPALIFGKPLWDIIGVYFGQTQDFTLLSMNAPTLLELINQLGTNPVISKIFVVIGGLFVIAVILYTLIKKEIYMSNENALLFSLLFSIGIPFFLPHMHDRYFYFATVFSLICVFAYGKKVIPVLIMTEAASLICYLHYFKMANNFFTPFLEIVLSKPVACVLMVMALSLTALYIISKKVTFKKAFFTALSAYIAASVTGIIFYL